MIGQYVYNVAFALDRFANALLGGDPDWTISQRMGEAIKNDRCLVCYGLCRLLHLIDPNHCRRSHDPTKPHRERLWGAVTASLVGVGLVAVVAIWTGA